MALPEYNRTTLRQVQPADMSSAKVWETLANTLDNFSAQLSGFANTQIAQTQANQAAKKADLKYQTSLELTASKYEKSQNDALIARQLAAEKYAASQARQKASDERQRIADERARDLRASTAYVNSMEAEVLKTFRELSIVHINDHEGYMNAATAAAEVWLENETLDGTEGMRQLFTTMVNNKMAQYAEIPYQNTITQEREEQKTEALNNIDENIADAVFQAEDWVTKANQASIDIETNPQEFEDQRELVENQYEVLETKIDNLVLEHDLSADEALALETELKTRFLSGVITAQLAIDMNNDEGWDSIEKFYENPNKFIKNNPYIAAMFPEGFKITDTERDEIWKELLDYKDTVNKHDDYAQKKELEALEIEHNDNFSETLFNLADMDKDDPQDIQDLLDNDKISNEQHDALIYALTSDKYAQEDAEVVSDILFMLFDPKSKDTDIYDAIVEATAAGHINRNTIESMLTKLRSGTLNELTNSFEFKHSMNMIRMGLTKDADKYTEGEANAVRYAQDEFYKRIIEGEKPLDIYDEIIDRYQKVLTNEGVVNEPIEQEVVETEKSVEVDFAKAGSTYQNSVYDSETKFNTYFEGKHGSTKAGSTYQNSVYDSETKFNTYFEGKHGSMTISNAIQTEIKIGEQLENGLLTESQGAELMKQLHDYMRSLQGLEPIEPYIPPLEILDALPEVSQ